MPSQNNEASITIALSAIQKDPKLSIRKAAQLYSINRSTLAARMKGRRARNEVPANSMRLTVLEEETLLKFILDLDSRGFPPRLSGVEEMANLLLAERGGGRVGQNWASHFVTRQPDLKTRFNRPYDYQRALCEDPVIIDAWFKLVANMKAKYGIIDADFYNFDETGFMMGVISSSMVVTGAERRGKVKTVQPGNREWVTVIQGINAEGWVLPPFIVVKGSYHLGNWYTEGNLPTTWVIKPTDNGWTDNTTGFEWIQHFDKYTINRTKGKYRMLVVDGHESHQSAEFERFCKERNIIPICMPSHSSHLLQPLDVALFSPLKRAYSRKIEELIKYHTTHITKVEFFSAFKDVFPEVFNETNIKAGFRGAGLVPHDPLTVLSRLDIRLRTPTPTRSFPEGPKPWVSSTPHNPIEALSQSSYIKERIAHHQGSSPTPIYDAVDQIAKGTQAIMHEVVLLREENKSLRKANETLSKRRQARRTRVAKSGALEVGEAQDLLAQKDVDDQISRERRPRGGRLRRAAATIRRCGSCGKAGHNARTCIVDIDSSGDSDESNIE